MILQKLESIKIQSRDWFIARAHGVHAQALLAFVAFSESSFFPIPTVTFLIPILLVGAKRWLYYALFTTFFSVLGGIFGYFVGVFFFDTVGVSIVSFYGLTEEMMEVQSRFNNNAFLVIFVGAFTPLPYKVFVLSAGFLKIQFLSFILASVLGRGLQFFAVSFALHIFGERIARLLFRYFTIVAFVLAFIIVVWIITLVLNVW